MVVPPVAVKRLRLRRGKLGADGGRRPLFARPKGAAAVKSARPRRRGFFGGLSFRHFRNRPGAGNNNPVRPCGAAASLPRSSGGTRAGAASERIRVSAAPGTDVRISCYLLSLTRWSVGRVRTGIAAFTSLRFPAGRRSATHRKKRAVPFRNTALRRGVPTSPLALPAYAR
jgi:hypothetical protein